jgi:uncharacterized protein
LSGSRKGQKVEVDMKCPACFNELAEIQVGNVRVDACQGGCGGIWFDAFEMQRVAREGAAAETALMTLRTDRLVQVDPQRKRECPRCPDVKLHRHFFSARRRVQVDECPSCGGYWLDAGELAIIRQEMSADNRVGGNEEATVSSEFIRYLYRLKTTGRIEP